MEFETQHKAFFATLIMDPTGKQLQTIEEHLENMKTPMVWASQSEIQATVELYSVPLYLYTQTPDKHGYHWLHYKPRLSLDSTGKQRHIELAHPGSVHFDLIVDADTMNPSLNPPQLTGMTTVRPVVLD